MILAIFLYIAYMIIFLFIPMAFLPTRDDLMLISVNIDLVT